MFADPSASPRRFLTGTLTAAVALAISACGPVHFLAPDSQESSPAGTSFTENVPSPAAEQEPAQPEEAPRPEPQPGPEETSAQGTGVPEAVPEITVEEMVEDMNSAEAVVDDYWNTHWADFFTGGYSRPNVVGLYDGTDSANAPTCDGETLQPDNAYYCIPEDYVAWDSTLMARGFEIGDAWPYLVIAHEWGHAVQARLDSSLRADANELQADCFAGAVLFGAQQDGTLQFESGDQSELVTALSTLGDETPWTNSEDHGDPFQRVEAFNAGRSGGVPSCLPTQ
jgi:uncharacterized protein